MRRSLTLTIAVALSMIGLGMVWAAGFSASPPTAVSGASPFASCTADEVDRQPGEVFPDSEVEPWADVNPIDGDNIVVGYQQDRWSNGGARGLVAGVTLNGGRSWRSVVIPSITLCSGGTTANGGDFQRATDPWLSFAPNGHLYFMSLSLDITTPPDRSGGFGKNAMFVSKSIDGGLSWSDPIKLAEDQNPRFLNDKNAITADPGDERFVYAVWDRLQLPVGEVINPENVFGLGFKGPAVFSRTTNGGLSWEAARIIYDPAGNNQTIGNQIVVLPAGTLVNFFNEILNFRNDDGGAQFEFNLSLIRSADQGATWPHGPALHAAKMQSLALFRLFGVVDPDTGEGVRTGDVIPQMAVDRNSESPGYGNLYAVWQDARFSGFRYDEIALAVSSDGGLTWSAPIKINRTPTDVPPGNRQAFLPMVRVAENGTVGVAYYDFRNNTPRRTTLPTDYFIVHCHPSLASPCVSPTDWGDEVRLTRSSFDMRRAPVARGFFLGDYVGLVAVGSIFKPLFVQSGPVAGTSNVFITRVGP